MTIEIYTVVKVGEKEIRTKGYSFEADNIDGVSDITHLESNEAFNIIKKVLDKS